ncbi:heterokaryon incompatibility protein-domain-containing protein [Nemania sp. FL0916]|nr:heterokaryon incompatibility protein-domain-containing protein [Nemania sp. FL0916]
MAAAQPFLHEPLPSPRSIRLLSLAPSTDSNSVIRCTVATADLDNLRHEDSYEALSYVWGSPTGTIPIRCNDKELLVTPNLHDALRQLRGRTSWRVLWIDAICIDQRKNERSTLERNRQVEMMAEVYRAAQTVLVWLGVGDESTPRAFRVIKALGLIARIIGRHRVLGISNSLVFRGLTRHLYGSLTGELNNVPNILIKYKHDIRKVLNNPWFSRVWTFQESASARKCHVLCGKIQPSWSTYEAAVPFLAMFALDVKRMLLIILRPITSGSVFHGIRSSFLDYQLAKVIGCLNSTLPQDKVYGLYSALTRCGYDLKSVDYRLTSAEVYGDAAKAFIKMEPRNLKILRLSIRPLGYDELPTWIPNWTTGHPHYPNHFHKGVDFTGHHPLDIETFRASGDSVATMPRPYPHNELHVKGTIIGKVSRVIVSLSAAEPSDLVLSRTHISSFTQACRNFVLGLDTANNIPSIYMNPSETQKEVVFVLDPNPESKRSNHSGKRLFCSVFFNILRYPNCGDLPGLARLENSDVTGEQRYLEVIERVLDEERIEASRSRLTDPVIHLLKLVSDFYHRYCLGLANWSFLFLDTGHIGRAYFNSRENDSVALLAGSTVPFLLREVDAGQNRYQVVAPAYICGVMEGQLWPEDNETGMKELTLV